MNEVGMPIMSPALGASVTLFSPCFTIASRTRFCSASRSARSVGQPLRRRRGWQLRAPELDTGQWARGGQDQREDDAGGLAFIRFFRVFRGRLPWARLHVEEDPEPLVDWG